MELQQIIPIYIFTFHFFFRIVIQHQNMEASGDCLSCTYWWLADQLNKNDFTIIHAMVKRFSDVPTHPHAVVYNTSTGNIHEVSNRFKSDNIVLPFKEWMILGHVSKIQQYSFKEYTHLLLSTRKWCVWHLEQFFRSIFYFSKKNDWYKKTVRLSTVAVPVLEERSVERRGLANQTKVNRLRPNLVIL